MFLYGVFRRKFVDACWRVLSENTAPRDVLEDARTLATIDTPPATPAAAPTTSSTQSPLAPTPSNAARNNQLVEMVAAAVEQMGVDDAQGGGEDAYG